MEERSWRAGLGFMTETPALARPQITESQILLQIGLFPLRKAMLEAILIS